MKKVNIFALLLCAVMLFAFCGCADNSSSKEVVLTDVLTSINTEFSISTDEMRAIEDTDTLELYYGIAPADVKQFAAETTKNSAEDITEIILVEAIDEDAAQRVFDALEIRYNSQRDLCASYSAELLAVVDECSVEQNGNFVTLIMSSESAAVTEHYNSFFE